jgi:hypothetical protein
MLQTLCVRSCGPKARETIAGGPVLTLHDVPPQRQRIPRQRIPQGRLPKQQQEQLLRYSPSLGAAGYNLSMTLQKCFMQCRTSRPIA